MSALVIPERLAGTAANVNHAHLFGHSIAKAEARNAEGLLVSRYDQDIPESIRKAKQPNPRWATVPKSFNLSDEEKAERPKTFTGEAVANASMRMIHSREAAHALYVLSEVTGRPTSEADELSAVVRGTADSIVAAARAPFF